MPINLPPLRARSREDLVDLAAHLLDELAPNDAGRADDAGGRRARRDPSLCLAG